MKASLSKLDRIFAGAVILLILLIALLNSVRIIIGVRILDSSPVGISVPVTARITITFNQPMERPSVEDGFSIHPAVEGSFQWNRNILTFTPEKPLSENQEYTVSLTSSARSENGNELKQVFSTAFKTRSSRIIYLHPADGESVMWKSERTGSPGDRIANSRTAGRILDYTASRDGSIVIFILQQPDGTSGIWKYDVVSGEEEQLVHCGDASCQYPALSPNQVDLAYFLGSASRIGKDPAEQEGLWILNLLSDQPYQLIRTRTEFCDAPSWSPDGTMLAWSDGSAGGIRIINVFNGNEQLLYSSIGISGSWSPDSSEYLFSDLHMAGTQPQGIIFKAHLEDQVIEPLFDLNGSSSSYRVPVISPDGNWLLTAVHNDITGPGYQLVLYSYPDLILQKVTDDPGYTYGAPVWHPSSTSILYQRIENFNPDAVPSVWLYVLETGSSSLISENAFKPGWLP